MQEFESDMYKLSDPENPFIENRLEYLELWKYDLELNNCSTTHLYRKKIPSTKQGNIPWWTSMFYLCLNLESSLLDKILLQRLVPMFQYIHTLASSSDPKVC